MVLQSSLGDCGWRELLVNHNRAVRRVLARWEGFENDTAGDGFYATFSKPDPGVRCALEIIRDVRRLGIAVRAGLHVGSCELIDDKCSGLTVSIGARVADLASPSEVLVTEAVVSAVHDEDLFFADRGHHVLKGAAGNWHLFAADCQPLADAHPRDAPTGRAELERGRQGRHSRLPQPSR